MEERLNEKSKENQKLDDRTLKMIMEINNRLGDVTINELKRKNNGRLRFEIYLNKDMLETGVEDMDLSNRSVNCLKRVGYDTVGNMINSINSVDDLTKIRNLGTKSAKEIMFKLFLFQYSHLEESKRERYIKKFKELNSR